MQKTTVMLFFLLLLSPPLLASPWQPVLQRPAVQAEAGVGVAALKAIRQDLETLYRVARNTASANDRAYLATMRDGLARQGLSWDDYYTDTLQFVRMVTQNNIRAHNRRAYEQEMRQLQRIEQKVRRYRRKSLDELLARH